MLIVKIQQNDTKGETILKLAELEAKPFLMDNNTVVFDARGVTEYGNRLVHYRVTLTRDELKTLNELAEK